MGVIGGGQEMDRADMGEDMNYVIYLIIMINQYRNLFSFWPLVTATFVY